MIKRLWHHRFLVSIAWNDTGRVRGYRIRAAYLITVLAFSALALGILSTYTLSLNAAMRTESLDKTYRTLADYEEKITRLTEEKSYQEKQFSVFTQELGVLQARLNRFDAISEKLFTDKEFGKHLQNIDEPEIPTEDFYDHHDHTNGHDFPFEEEAHMTGQGGPEAFHTQGIADGSLEDLHTQLSSLNNIANNVEMALEAGVTLLSRHHEDQIQQPSFWPVIHTRTHMSSPFGYRKNPFNGKKSFHSGMDIAAGLNASVVSAADGIVVFAGYRYAYGILVEIRHAGGYTTRYGHLNRATVKNGDQVSTGDLIGLMGSTGRSSGPHLHFEILKNDIKVDPLPFIRGGRIEAIRMAKAEKKK